MLKYSYNNILEPWYPEEFKIINMEPIKKDMYAISNYGKVMNIKSGKVLSQVYANGYIETALQNNDNTRSLYFNHILVAYHFIPKTIDDINNNRVFVNHKNLIKNINYVHNLEWVNSTENAKHAQEYKHLKLRNPIRKLTNGSWGNSNAIGSKNGMSRLNEDQVHTICKLLEKNYSYKDIFPLVGLEGTENDLHLIKNIKIGKRWKHISSNYNIPQYKKMPKFTSYVIPVCELLVKGYSNEQIFNKLLQLGFDNNKSKAYSFINRIRRRDVYSDITKNYRY